RRALIWGWSPLAALEAGMNAHVDVVGIALLCAALWSLEERHARRGGVLIGLSAGIKWLPLTLLPLSKNRRVFTAGVLALLLCTLPFADAGARLRGSLGEYGRRWRGNDGAFALVQTASEAAVARTRFVGRVDLV